jgi:hypothetical protein
MLYLMLLIAAAAAGMLQTITGFGSAILLMLVLPHFFTMLQAPALSSSITLALTVALAWKFRKHLDLRLLLLPVLLYEVSSVAALTVADRLNLELLSLAFGVFLVALSLYFLLLSSTFTVRPTPVSAAVCSLISGVCSGLFGIGGPLMAVYFLSATDTKESYVANVQCLFAVTTGINLLIRMQKGFYTLDLLPFTLLGMVGISLGKALGLRVLNRIPIEAMKKLVYGFVGVAGVLNLLGL